MAKIKTRDTESNTELLEKLHGLIDSASLGQVSFGANAVVEPEDTVDGCIEQLDKVIDALHMAGQELATTVSAMAYDNLSLASSVELLNDTVSHLTTVEFDEALNEAATDLMIELEAGGGDISADRVLSLTQVTFTHSEMKNIIRSAILRWIAVKLR